jgi:hypothetical protein
MSDNTAQKKSILDRFVGMAGLATPRTLVGRSNVAYTAVAVFFSLLFLYVAGPSFLVHVPIQYQRAFTSC